jgi:hypothetical protein
MFSPLHKRRARGREHPGAPGVARDAALVVAFGLCSEEAVAPERRLHAVVLRPPPSDDR